MGDGLSKALFSWFSPKRGNEIVELAKKNFALTKDAIRNMKNMIEETDKGNMADADSHFWSLHENISEAYSVRRAMIEKISLSDMFPEEKMDIIDLAKALAFIGDSGNEAGRLLSVLDFQKVPAEMKELILDIAKDDYACMEALSECFQAMRGKPKACVELTGKVEGLEEKVDQLYAKSRQNFAKLNFDGWNPGPLYLLIEFMESLEAVSDWCENTSDIIKAIAVKIQ